MDPHFFPVIGGCCFSKQVGSSPGPLVFSMGGGLPSMQLRSIVQQLHSMCFCVFFFGFFWWKPCHRPLYCRPKMQSILQTTPQSPLLGQPVLHLGGNKHLYQTSSLLSFVPRTAIGPTRTREHLLWYDLHQTKQKLCPGP